MEFKKAVVTGGAGFIGSHIAGELLKDNIETVVIDNLYMGKEEYIPKGARFIKMDILDRQKLEDAFAGADIVFHQAAHVSIRNSIDNFYNDAYTNIMGTVNVIGAVIKKGIKKLIYASSMGVYGEAESLPIKETQKLEPTSPYGISKLAAEKYCLQMSNFFGFDAVSLRYFNTFGIRQTLTPYVGVITIFINRMLKGKPPRIFGDGKQVRDFVSVSDIAYANILAMQHGRNGQVMNIASGKGTTVNEVAQVIIDRLGSGVVPEYTAPKPGEPGSSIADITRAEEFIGYKPRYSLIDKIDAIINWNKNIS
ncbi:MAG: NAD-dependent epimerase/dehydratase family protein [Candidatus Omnitrophota bacterium]|nr:MAG: NAD-dependent epimerase/dehydratase family protein [Candidatus Omnitrophota bacterium]